MSTYRIAFLVVAVSTSPAVADAVYDDLGSGTDGAAFFGDVVIDDLHVATSGRQLITTVTIAVTAPSDLPAQTSDVSLLVARDGGDGVPSIGGPGDDAFMIQMFRPAVTVQPGEILELSFDVRSSYTTVTEKTLLWGGVQFSNPLVNHAFYGAPTVGTTDDTVFSLMGGGPVSVPGVTDPALTQSFALAFQLDAIPLPGRGGGGPPTGATIDFEDLAEGAQGQSVTVGEATFAHGWDGFAPPEDAFFVADDGTEVWEANPPMLEFVDGTCLQLGGWGAGPETYVFSIMRSMTITPEAPRTGAALSVNYVANSMDADYRQSEVTLLALQRGEPVASDTVRTDQELGTSFGGTFTFGAARLQVSGPEFDELVLFVNGSGGGPGGILGGIDNVVLGTGGIPGDVDGDGIVGVGDLLAVLSAWGACPGCPADLDGDGDVGVSDLLTVLANWTA